MSTLNLAISDSFSREALLDPVAGRAAGDSAERPEDSVYALPAICGSRAVRAPTGRFRRLRRDPVVGWQVREEGEYYIPDPSEDEDFDPDPALFDAAEAHTEEQREAMAIIDDAENLLAVLLASIEQESDSRAMQADTVLRIAKKKLRKAHARIDRQEADHRNLFLAYFELKERSEKDPE
jgi:hypothetical protein